MFENVTDKNRVEAISTRVELAYLINRVYPQLAMSKSETRFRDVETYRCTSSEQLRQSAAAKKRGLSHRVGVQATAC
jgi:hypothetical protein